MLLALSLGLMQQLTGTEAILYYAPQILAGLSPTVQFAANLGVGFSKLIGELVSAAVVDRYGRRTMTIGGNFLLSCSIVGIALSFQHVDAPRGPLHSVVGGAPHKGVRRSSF